MGFPLPHRCWSSHSNPPYSPSSFFYGPSLSSLSDSSLYQTTLTHPSWVTWMTFHLSHYYY